MIIGFPRLCILRYFILNKIFLILNDKFADYSKQIDFF